MTYDEIKQRLTEVETALQSMQPKKSPQLETSYTNKSIHNLNTLKESLQKQLAEKEETMFISTKGGDTKAVKMDRKSAMDLKKDPAITGIDTAKGQSLKELDRLVKNSGIEFDKNETGKIATQVGRALAIALKKAGDELARMKAHRIDINSFDIEVIYKGEGGSDEFAFHIVDDKLHLVDFSFDKELVDIGVKPSGEAIINRDVLANELLKHFKSLNEKTNYKGRELSHEEEDRLDLIAHKEFGGKDFSKLSDEDKEKVFAKRDQVGVKEGEGDDHHYIKVPRMEFKAAERLIASNIDGNHVKMDYVDDDGMGNVIIYFMFKDDAIASGEADSFMYDAVMDLQSHGIDIQDHSAELDEMSKPEKGEKEEAELNEDDLDVGHQDDEPSMLKSSAFETATYAAKLAKKLAQYDQVDGEVDFPNWWQKKLILARDYMSAAYHYLDSEEKQPLIDKLALEEGVNEGTELYDKGGLQIKRFSGGKRGVMVQITAPSQTGFGGDYIQVTADQFVTLAKAMQPVQGDLMDMSTQIPRRKNIDEIKAAKIQKAHSQVVAKMKELAKQYKAGDKSVVPQLKDLTAKKKELEKHLDQAVAGTHHNQELTELSGDQREAIMDLQSILDDLSQKGDEAREIVRQSFPRMLSKGDAYGAFEFGTSGNRYDTTLESIIEEIEEYYDEEEDDMDEGKYKSDAQRKAIYATKAEKNEAELSKPETKQIKKIVKQLKKSVKGHGDQANYLGKLVKEFTDNRFTGADLIDDVSGRSPDMFTKQLFADLLPKGVASENDAIEALKAHDKSPIKARMGQYAPMFVHMQYHELEHEGEKYRMHQTQYYNSNFKDKDPDFNPGVSKITLMKVDENDEGQNLGVILVKTDQYVQDLRNLPGLGKRHMEEAKGGQIFPGDYVKTQHGDIYMRVDGKVGKHDAYVRVIRGKVHKRKTALHHSMKLTLVNKDELNEFDDKSIKAYGNAVKKAYGVKVGDILTKDGKKGKVVKVMDDMANVDFGNGDVYGITFGRIKGKEITKEAAPGYKHDCAAKVVHETYGVGICIPEKHTLVKEGNKHVVTHYDVLFKEGKKVIEDIPVEELKIVTQKEHWHKGYKKKKK